MPSQTSPKAGPTRPDIPDKLYFRIGEVARLCAVPAYVLRFWESEFTQLKPNKSGTGQRLYRKRDVETALKIKRLLYDEGYTIPGARHAFQAEAKLETSVGSKSRKRFGQPALPLPAVESNTQQTLLQVRAELRELLTLLSTPARSRRTSRPPPGLDGEKSSLFQTPVDTVE